MDNAKEVFLEIDGLIKAHTNRHVEHWKAEGKPVLGYTCHYVPTELLLAAGALPLRMRGTGSEDSSLGDSYLSGRTCTYVRHVVSLALDEQYDFLDGVISLNTCDHIRRAADVFKKKTAIPYCGFVSVPRNPRESLFSYYKDELANLRQELADHLGVAIDDDALREGIKKMNATRGRLRTINKLRLEEAPRLNGAESLSIHIASHVLPTDVFIELADRLIAQLENRGDRQIPLVRLVLMGAELDEPKYVAAIESQEAMVVADLLCFGARSVLDPIDEEAADPLDAIGRAYYFRPSCARMIGDFPGRYETLTKMVERAKADGVVFTRLVFCDPWGADVHNISNRLAKENTFPMLFLTREYGIVPTGQIRTRVQAFVEKLEIAKAKDAFVGDKR